MKVIAVVFGLFVIAVVAQPPVEVMLLEESMCPNCVDFVKKDLGKALEAPGVAAIVDLHVIPWGNSYCETTECPSKTPGKYNVDIRVCWNRVCGAAQPPADCYNISKQTCQHGTDECRGDRIEACAIGLYKTAVARWWQFVVCFVGDNAGKLSAAEHCATAAGLDWAAIDACAAHGSEAGDAFELANARATNAPGAHQGVPWAYVNGVHKDSGMLAAICAAYTGTKPAGCK